MTPTISHTTPPSSPPKRSCERGALLVEFVLVTPIILFILAYVIRLVVFMQAHQIAMTVSREVATRIFRECADFSILAPQTFENDGSDSPLKINTAISSQAIKSCLIRAYSSITDPDDQTSDNWRNILKPIGASDTLHLNLTVYRYAFDRLTPPEDCTNPQNQVTEISFGTRDSKLGETTPEDSVVCTRNRVVKAELSFEVTPPVDLLRFMDTLTVLVPGLSLPEEMKTIHEETII